MTDKGSARGPTQLERVKSDDHLSSVRHLSGHETLLTYRHLDVSLGSEVTVVFVSGHLSLVSIVESRSNLYKDYPVPPCPGDFGVKPQNSRFRLPPVHHPKPLVVFAPTWGLRVKRSDPVLSHRSPQVRRLRVETGKSG